MKMDDSGALAPLVSICVPVYNMAGYLEQCVLSAIHQTHPNVEVVIWDDGSTDNSLDTAIELAERYPNVRVCGFENNQGAIIATNNALRAATGEYLMVLPADDLLFDADILRRELMLLQNPRTVFATTKTALSGADGQPYVSSRPWLTHRQACNMTRERWKQCFQYGNFFFGANLHRRSTFETVGYFDESLKQLADLDMYLRCLTLGDIVVIEEPLYRTRITEGNLSAPTEANGKLFRAELDDIRRRHYKPKESAKMKLMIATPFYENKGYSPYIRSLFQTGYLLARQSNLEFDFVEVSGGSYIHHNRNLIANRFMNSDFTHLLFIDSDQSWDVQGFLNLLKADVDIVGCAYPVKNNWEHWGVTIHSDENGRPLVNKDGLIKADKVPCGMMKIKRQVFERLRDENPDSWYWEAEGKLYDFFSHLIVDHIMYGEDISFGLRWHGIGGEMWVEPRCSMGHHGTQGWFGNYDQYLRKQAGGDLSAEPAPQLEAA